MKAIAKTRPEFGAEFVEIPVKHPGREELLVKVAACGICGSDLHIYEWELGAERCAPRLPLVLGHEPAGVVVDIGPEVTGFKRGDRVALDPFGHCGRCPHLSDRAIQSLHLADHAQRRVRRIHDRAGRQFLHGASGHEPRAGRFAGAVRHRSARRRAIQSQGRRQRGGRRAGTDRTRAPHSPPGAWAPRRS